MAGIPSCHARHPEEREINEGGFLKVGVLVLSIIGLIVGAIGGPILTRLYFLHGGSRVWVTTFLQYLGFPLSAPLILFAYVNRRRRGERNLIVLSPKPMVSSIGIGILSAVVSYLFAYGSISLPVSTSTLIFSSQAMITAFFAFILVKHKITLFTVNALVLLVIGIVLLGVQSSTERPPGEPDSRYFKGFFAMIGSAFLYGLMLPLIEWTFLKFKQTRSFAAVIEMQIFISIAGAAFVVVAMIINHDFQAIPREAEVYEFGKTKYYLIFWGAAMFWQINTLGYLGVIACSSSLLAGIILAVLVPLGEIMAVLLLNEKFNSGKAVSMVLCIWAFVSFLYGEYLQTKNKPGPHQDHGGSERIEPC